MTSFLVQASGRRVCQFSTIGLDALSLIIEATPEDDAPARLLILGTRLVSVGHEGLTWCDDPLLAGTEVNVTSVASEEGDAPRVSVRTDSEEGAARQQELRRVFEELDAGTLAPRSIPIPLPWQMLAFHVTVGPEVICVAQVTEERPILSLHAVWNRWRPDRFWLSASSQSQGWPPSPRTGHRWLDKHVSTNDGFRVTVLAEKRRS